MLKLYNTKEAKEMRLALVEDRTVLCRIASKSEPVFSPPSSSDRTKTKGLATCFPRARPCLLRGECTVFSLKYQKARLSHRPETSSNSIETLKPKAMWPPGSYCSQTFTNKQTISSRHTSELVDALCLPNDVLF